MNCVNCNHLMNPEDEFCQNCGTKAGAEASVAQASTPAGAGVKPPALDAAQTLLPGADGVYRWVYEVNMWTNPTLVITLLKVLAIAALAPTLLVSGLALFEQGPLEAAEAFMQVGMWSGFILLGLFVIAYPTVAIMNGGKYCVAFEMDAHSIKHIQMEKQYKRSQVLSMITMLAGAAAGSPTAVGAGLLAGSKRSSTSAYGKVRTLVAKPSRHVIYVNEALNRNQIYVEKEAYEAVLTYLADHCKKAKVVRK